MRILRLLSLVSLLVWVSLSNTTPSLCTFLAHNLFLHAANGMILTLLTWLRKSNACS